VLGRWLPSYRLVRNDDPFPFGRLRGGFPSSVRRLDWSARRARRSSLSSTAPILHRSRVGGRDDCVGFYDEIAQHFQLGIIGSSTSATPESK
jgi:hypothetical protein